MNEGPGIKLNHFLEKIYCCYIDINDRVHDDMVTDHMLVYVSSGEMVVLSNGQSITFKSGDTFFIKRNHLIHTIKQPDPQTGISFKALFFVFTVASLKMLTKENEFPSFPEKHSKDTDRFVFSIEKHPFIDGLFLSLEKYFDSGEVPIQSLVETKLKEAICILLQLKSELYTTLFDYATPWKIDLYEFMNKYFYNDLTIREFAHYTGRSLTSFKREFRNIFQDTPNKWLVRKRLTEARRLLLEKKFKPSDVYLEVGFKNFSHFSTAFKKEFGYSPSNNN